MAGVAYLKRKSLEQSLSIKLKISLTAWVITPGLSFVPTTV